jgi:hypothetical protein
MDLACAGRDRAVDGVVDPAPPAHSAFAKGRAGSLWKEDAMPFKMSSFVFWSGIYNTALAFVLLFPPLYRALGLNVCNPVWAWLIAGFLAYTSVTLIYASRDLTRRAPLVYWEALLRFVAALILVPAGVFGDIGLIAALLGLGDLAIGLVYVFGLTKELGVSHEDLLLERLGRR